MLDHRGTRTLTTPRLKLRAFHRRDAADMFRNWAHDAEVTRFLTWQPHLSQAESARCMDIWCPQYRDARFYQWAIEHEGQVIGSISVVRLSDRDEWAELGYCIGRPWWGQGLMTEAASAVIDYLFGVVGFHRVAILHAVENPASGRVAQKCGLDREGVRRDYARLQDGRFVDVIEYALLRPDWEARHSK